jgi:hypothetical protein
LLIWDDFEVFQIHFQKSGGFVKITRFLTDFHREVGVKNEFKDFIKITRLFEHISRKMEVSV